MIAEPEARGRGCIGRRPGSAVAAYLERLHARHGAIDDGEVATYIPELSRVDPSLFGICIATVDGAVYEAGDTHAPFTIQSMSKPLTYGLALERLGTDAVRSRIGVEPSGDAFNEISLSPETGMPRNPLINAGAIACAGLVAGAVDDPFALLLDDLLALRGARARVRRGRLPLRDATPGTGTAAWRTSCAASA